MILAAVKSSAFSTPSFAAQADTKTSKIAYAYILPSARRSGTRLIKASMAAVTISLHLLQMRNIKDTKNSTE